MASVDASVYVNIAVVEVSGCTSKLVGRFWSPRLVLVLEHRGIAKSTAVPILWSSAT
jgi:hypothetical protein